MGVGSTGNAYCTFTFTGGPPGFGATIYWSQQPHQYITQEPKTLDQLADDIALNAGWPVASTLAKAAADALAVTGASVQTQGMTVTGPATSTGTTITTNNADGTKTTVTQTFNHTYNGDTVNTVTNTTTNNYNTSNVITSTSASTSTPAATPADQKTDCQLFPNSVGCQELGTAIAPALPQTDSGFSQITPVTFASSASCPSDLSFSVMGHSYALSYAGLCSNIGTFIRPILLVLSAGLAAFIFVNSFRV